ncbi:hypothetical protein lerEdw1_001373, partial [Lerista edwardsae]
ILFATDDFFAPAENLLKKQRPVFHADLFTDYGKWRDGWETRRKRIPGYDWCIIQLGVTGIIYGFEADTSYFAGNCAPRISIQAACLKPEKIPSLPPRRNRIGTTASDEEFKAIKEQLSSLCFQIKSDEWTFLVPMTVLKSGSLDTVHNYFPVTVKEQWTHLRLNVYPGIGRAKSIKDGWETGRNLQRPPILQAIIKFIIFFSSFQLKPHKRHFFDAIAIQKLDVFTHVRLTVAPDGGISRMRLWGFPRALSHVNK